MSPFDDLRADVFSWLPAIQDHLPGCGLTPFNVWDLPFEWWRVYRDRTERAVQELKNQSRANGGRNG